MDLGHPARSATLERVNRLIPGSQWAGDTKTADGSATVAAIIAAEAPRPGPQAHALLITGSGFETLVDLGFANTVIRRPQVSVIVVAGWSGDAPASVRKPPPLATPRPTLTEPAFVAGTPYPDRGPDYPRPKGERVPPQVADVPVYPGAREVDGFVATGTDGSRTTGNVQLFLTKDRGDEVLDFYRFKLGELGFRPGAGAGPGTVPGKSWSYANGRDRVVISTVYIPRPEDQLPSGVPPYGFQGKGVRFIETIDGETFFFVVTLRAPEP